MNLLKTETIGDMIRNTYDNGTIEEYIATAKINEPTEEETKPTQLDRIEEKVSRNYAEAQQEAIDGYTLNLIEEGVL